MRLLAVALAILVVDTGRASAQWQRGALRIGIWLASTIAGYPIGKALDQVVGTAMVRDNEAELTAIQLNLQKLYKKSIAKHSNVTQEEVSQVKQALVNITSELEVLHSLMRQPPTREDLSRYRAEVERDIAALNSAIARHEKILQQQERKLHQHDKTLREHDVEIAELQRRLDQQLDQQQVPPPGPPCSLTVMVEGTSNVIRLHTQRWCEVSGNAVASGIVHVSGQEVVVDYCIARGTGAVVELAAPSAWVSMPASLSDLVEIHDNGWTFQRWVYPDP